MGGQPQLFPARVQRHHGHPAAGAAEDLHKVPEAHAGNYLPRVQNAHKLHPRLKPADPDADQEVLKRAVVKSRGPRTGLINRALRTPRLHLGQNAYEPGRRHN